MIVGRGIIAKPIDEYTNNSEAHVQAHNQVAHIGSKRNQRVISSTGRSCHHIEISWVETKCCRWWPICDKVHPKQLDWSQALGNSKRRCEKNCCHLSNVRGDHVSDKCFHVTVYVPTFFHSRNDTREVVILQDHCCCILGHGSASDTHGNANCCLFQSRCIIYAITSHCSDLLKFLEDLYNLLLVSGFGARKDSSFDSLLGHNVLQNLSLLLQAHFFEFFSGKGAR
mmetsp:Transcript_27967/g.44993  ORF Transcript_27967/g.44993 Transcript_27967/m.44993 type:complete len:226 (-) Transcript_27967:1234-1911(-)